MSDQRAAFWALAERMDAACEDPRTLGVLRDEALAADLQEDDRADLLGRAATYAADHATANDPVEQQWAGDPSTPLEPPVVNSLAVPEDDDANDDDDLQ